MFIYEQVESKREELLSHPLVTNLLSWKWGSYGGYLYYLKLLLYCVFLLFLTAYIIETAPLRFPYRQENCKIDENDLSDSLKTRVFVGMGRYLIVGLSLIHLIFEVNRISWLLNSVLFAFEINIAKMSTCFVATSILESTFGIHFLGEWYGGGCVYSCHNQCCRWCHQLADHSLVSQCISCCRWCRWCRCFMQVLQMLVFFSVVLDFVWFKDELNL